MNRLLRLPILSLSILLAGCVSSGKSVETDYYVLSSPQLADQKLAHGDIKVIALGPITFADYLKRASIVERNSSVNIKVSNVKQWAGNIENEFQIALLKHFTNLDSRYLYVKHPSMLNTRPLRRLRVDILRFDVKLDGPARLEAVWAWLDQHGEVVAAGNFSRTSRAESTHAGAVSAMSALLQQFSTEVHQALTAAAGSKRS
ncbi:membrane integrity-associated transporter subunit PqiC [Exilibacterium tricleocarpae]|uniref:Membrane integrity-associated transporter subunit PqiC n=1 Tax=Exilibacterium tricleocarpae TaxID=2591008 RepID=A0A545U9K7_9GAMM|nr:PqiC family protein [Exilibacterium tricleocarpae]TQV86150.1 membrane integrity-associated transporter subunit PqiC [Exilibacterium tricleocarpae]